LFLIFIHVFFIVYFFKKIYRVSGFALNNAIIILILVHNFHEPAVVVHIGVQCQS